MSKKKYKTTVDNIIRGQVDFKSLVLNGSASKKQLAEVKRRKIRAWNRAIKKADKSIPVK